MPDEATWDSAATAADASTPVIETATDPPVEVTTPDTPAPTTPPETPETAELAPVEPEPAPPREEATVDEKKDEKDDPKKDDYVAEADDPTEIAALPTPAAKRWAKRQFKDAAPIRAFLEVESPISKVTDTLYGLSKSRYYEMVDDLITLHKEDAAQQLFGTSYEDAKSRLTTPTTTNGHSPQPTTTPDSPATALTEDDLLTLSNAEVVQRFEATLAAHEAKLRTEYDAKLKNVTSQFETVNGQLTEQQQRGKADQIASIKVGLYDQVFPVVDEGIRELGLEIQKDDPPRIANLKKVAAKMFRDGVGPTFDADEDNLKVIARVDEFAKRLERENAFREVDNLKVRTRAAFGKVKETDEVKAILDEITAHVTKSKATPRTVNPAPPVAGATAGINVKAPANWDEAIKQAGATA